MKLIICPHTYSARVVHVDKETWMVSHLTREDFLSGDFVGFCFASFEYVAGGLIDSDAMEFLMAVTSSNPKPMNRQARLQGHEYWQGYGAVTYAQAAKSHAAAFFTSPLFFVTVEVRDESTPDDIRTIPVRQVITYECTLRDEACNRD